VQAGRGEPATVKDARRFFIDFLPIQRRRIRREGVFLHDIAYWSDVLTTWVGEPDKMIVRYDPRDLSRIYLQSPDGPYFDLPYRDLGRRPISLWEHRLAVKRVREEGHRLVNEDTIFEAIEHLHHITENAVLKTKSVRRQRERRKQWAKVERAHPDAPSTEAPRETQHKPLPPHERLFTDVEEWG
jgi:putative transposase